MATRLGAPRITGPSTYALNASMASAGLDLMSIGKRGGGGNVNYSMVAQNMNSIFGPPRSRELLQEIDQSGRQLDYTDLQSEYNGRSVPIQMDVWNASMHNQQNIGLLRSIAPIVFTPDYNFTSERMEVIDIPFDKMGPNSIARMTRYSVSSETQSMEHFKRSGEIDVSLLQDVMVGARRAAQISGSFASQAVLTLMRQVSAAVVDIPYKNEMRRLMNMAIPFHHAREIFRRNARMAIAHKSADMFMNALTSIPNRQFQPDTVLLPQGMSYLIARLQTQLVAQPTKYYTMKWDDAITDWIVNTYDDGPLAVHSIPYGVGGVLNAMELAAYKADIDDPEDEAVQYLRSDTTCGEVGLMRIPRPFDEFTGRVHDLDIVLARHTPGIIEPAIVRYRSALAHSMLFNNYDGSLVDPMDDGPAKKTEMHSNIVNDLIISYNNTKLLEAYAYFTPPSGSNDFPEDINDRIPAKYLNSELSLHDMKDWRHLFGLLCFNNDTKQVEFPYYVGDTSTRSLPTADLAAMARYFVRLFREKHPVATANYIHLADFIKSVFPDFKVPANADADPTKPHGVKDGGAFESWIKALEEDKVIPVLAAGREDVNKESDKGKAKAAKDKDEADARRRKVLTLSVPFLSSPQAFLAVKTGETVDEFKGRLSAESVKNAYASPDVWGTDNTYYHEIMRHTPDGSLSHAAAVIHAAQTQKDLSEGELKQRLETFVSNLQGYSGREHSKEMLKKAARMLEAGKSWADFPTQGRWLIPAEEKRANAFKDAPVATVAARLRADESSSGPSTLSYDDEYDDEMDAMPTGMLGYPAADNVIGNSRYTPGKIGTEDSIGSNYQSWVAHADYMRKFMPDVLERVFFTVIAYSRFGYRTCDALARHGINLFRYNYMRPFMRFIMSSMVLLKAGPTSMFTAFGNNYMLLGLDAAQSYLSMHAQFKAAPICTNRNNFYILPWAMFDTYIGGRNTDFITTPFEFASNDPAKPSLLAVPVPRNERRYEDPMNLLNQATFGAPNSGRTLPQQKYSSFDLVVQFVGEDNLLEYGHFASETGVWESTIMCPTLNRACTGYASYTSNDVRWDWAEGTSTFGSIAANDRSTAPVYFGQEPFRPIFDTLITAPA